MRPDQPLATVVVLSCNRGMYARLALGQIASQDYPGPLEALVVDDGDVPVEEWLRREYPELELVHEGSPAAPVAPQSATEPRAGLVVRLLTLPRHATAGEKRAAAAVAARGEVILHWEDDDFHEPRRVSAQVGPILRGEADVTALELSYVAALPKLELHEARAGSGIILWSSLAYRASLGRELSFANVSLDEDVEFADRAVQRCHKMVVLSGVQSMCTRPEVAALGKPHRVTLADLRRQKVLQRAEAPPWAAELHHEEHKKLASMMLAMGAACPVVERRLPEGFVPEESTVPRMPSKCCTDPGDANCHWPTTEGHAGSGDAPPSD